MLDLETIDISNIDQDTATRVVHAAKTLGFLYLSHHSIPTPLIRQVFDSSKSLFALPRSEKQQYKITRDNRGWSDLGTETLDPDSANEDHKESFNISASSTQQMPEILDRSLFVTFEKACQELCARVFELLALGMDLPPSFFNAHHNPGTAPSGTITRMLYYPASSSTTTANTQQQADVVAGAHSDYGTITLLFQNPGQPGLQLLSPTTNQFESVPAPALVTASQDNDDTDETTMMPVLVNVGDQLDLWTSGTLKSTVHRVVNETHKERYSIAYFCHPDDSTPVIPIGQDVNGTATDTTSARAMTAGEHLKARLEATYAY